ncbi:MAG: hypothetical protein WC006_09500, partial [Bacilli bacterium]
MKRILCIFAFISILFLSACVSDDTESLKFEKIDDSSCRVVGYVKDNKKKTRYKIPEYYDGMLVVEIKEWAFRDNEDV